jgi:membrane-associated phospholipid phosphatase
VLERARLWPHEAVFGAYLALTWIRLVSAAGFFQPEALAFLGLLAADAVLILWCSAEETEFRWRCRLLFHPLAMNACYLLMRTAVPLFHPQLEDGLLQRVDAALVGGNLSVRLGPLITPLLTEALSFCYILFMPYLMFSMLWYFAGEVRLCRKFYSGLFTLYGIGFIGYTLVPALGPYLAMPEAFAVPLEGWRITAWNSEMVRVGSNRVDVFPSLHCAVSSYFLFFDREHKPWRYRLYFVPCVGLWLSTLYLRYHYSIDVVCGFALAAFCLWVARRFHREVSP